MEPTRELRLRRAQNLIWCAYHDLHSSTEIRTVDDEKVMVPTKAWKGKVDFAAYWLETAAHELRRLYETYKVRTLGSTGLRATKASDEKTDLWEYLHRPEHAGAWGQFPLAP